MSHLFVLQLCLCVFLELVQHWPQCVKVMYTRCLRY